MKYYWFSFSYKGKNNGVCVVEATSSEEAIQKTIDLNIHPPHDDIFSCVISELESGMTVDRLYSQEEMFNIGYHSITSRK